MGDFTGFMPEETGAEQIRVESFFKPNLQLLDRVLATRQQMYNTNLDTMSKAKAKVEEVNSLEGFDRKEWMTMQESYDKDIQGIMSLYEGDLSKANTELSGFTSKVGKDFGIHGKATAINERALGYMMNKKELDKRLAEGKIEHPQYWKLNKELEDTKEIGIGTDNKAYKGWRKINPIDAIKFPEFATKFLANKKADLKLRGYDMSQRGDFIEFTKKGAESISYDEVMEELSTAYNAEAEKTGQLRDAFDYHVYNNKINLTRDSYIQAWSGKVSEYQDRINKLSTLKGTELQEYINSIGGQIKVDNIIDTETITTKMALLDQAKNYIKKYNEKIDVVADDTKFNQQQVENLYYREFIDSEARKQADPYARAISHSRDILEHDVHKDPRADFEYAKALKTWEKLQEQVAPITNYTHGETIDVESLLKAKEGLRSKETELEQMTGKLNDPNSKLTKEERIKLQREIEAKSADIYNIKSNYEHIRKNMQENGYKPTDELLSEELIRLTSIVDPKKLALYEHTTSMIGNDYKNYIEQKEALLSGLSNEQLKAMFGETNIANIIKNDFGKNVPAEQKANIVKSIIGLYYEDQSGAMKNRFIEYSENRIGESTGGVTEIFSFGRTSAQTYWNSLKNKNEEEIVNYTEDKTVKKLTMTSQTITVDPSIKEHAVNREVSAWSEEYGANSSGYNNINGTQFDVTGKKFYNSKGEEVPESKSKSVLQFTTHAVNGKFGFIVKHKDEAGNPLFDSDDVNKRKESQSFMIPQNQSKKDGMRASLDRIGLAEMNWAVSAFAGQTGRYLTPEVQAAIADPQRKNRYDKGLEIVALSEYMGNLQEQGVHIMKNNSDKLVTFNDKRLSLYRTPGGTYQLYMPKADGTPDFHKKIKTFDANDAYGYNANTNAPLGIKDNFGSIEDISKSIYFSTNILRDLPKQDWE